MSDNKKLLSENTIRRFMTLANVGTLSDNFIQENASEEEINENDEEVTEEGMYAKRDEDGEDEEKKLPPSLPKDSDPKSLKKEENEELEEGGMYYARDDEEGEEELEMDAGLGMDDPADEAPADAADISLTEEEAQLLIDLGSRLGAAMGGADEPEPAMDAPADEPEMDVDDAMAAEDEEEEDPMMQEELVQEVLKRVTKRIINEKLKNK
tara:strand:+ start:3136 stop:3765 length:630 start_codon:yes stop_codon:yes gene_type:complete